jgi:hypothetical protein
LFGKTGEIGQLTALLVVKFNEEVYYTKVPKGEKLSLKDLQKENILERLVPLCG